MNEVFVEMTMHLTLAEKRNLIKFLIDSIFGETEITIAKYVEKKITPSQEAKSFFETPFEHPIYEEMERNVLAKNGNIKFVQNNLVKFCSYWMEMNKSGTKYRWQLEPTFEVKRRITTWFNRIAEKSGIGAKTEQQNRDDDKFEKDMEGAGLI